MIKLKHFSLFCTVILVLAACGEDRTDEYLVRTEEDRWIEEQMQNIYLWYYDMPQGKGIDYFAAPKEFFASLLSKTAQEGKGDKYSYIEIDEENSTRLINQESSYGFDFMLYSDPTKETSNRYARIIFVLPDSPAWAAGLKRGDWISGVNQEVLTENNYGYLYRGEERRFALASLNINENGSLYWINEDTLTIAASRPVEDNPFYVDTVYQVNGKRIAYLMYNRFSTGPGDTPEESAYNEEMKSVFAAFQSSGFDDFILDLRYNPGGYLTCAQLMTTMLAPSSALDKEFCSLQFNNKNTSLDQSFKLDPSLAGGVNLNLQRLYVIVSNLTASASESVINCLTPYMKSENIILIGTTTQGKNVASIPIPSPYNFTLHPIVATVLNAEGNSDYFKGMRPTYTLDESQYVNRLYPLGDIRELMLRNTLSLITTGTMPDVPADENEKGETRSTHINAPLFNSLRRKAVNAVLLNP